MRHIRLISSAILAAICINAFAESDKQGVTLLVNSDDGRFAKGEEIVFTAECGDVMDSTFNLSVFEDGVLKEEKLITLPAGRSTIGRFTSDSPKSFMLRLKSTGEKAENHEIAAIVAPEEYVIGFDEPDDFMKYWKAELKKMRRSKPRVSMIPIASSKAGYDAYDIEISMPEGEPVRGIMSMPSDAGRKSLPVLLFLHGAGVNKPNNRSNEPVAAGFASRGCIALDINAHGMKNHESQAYYDSLQNGVLKDYRTRKLVSCEEYYFRLMVLRAVRGMDFLCNLPQWDKRRAVVVGSSQGGFQSAAVAGLDKRVTYAEITVPAHTDLAASKQGRRASWPGCYDIALSRTPELAETVLPYFDGSIFLRHTDARIVMEAGLTDMTCPPGCVYAAFNSCPSHDKVMFTFPYRPHSAGGITEEGMFQLWSETISVQKDKMLDDYLASPICK